MKMKYEVKVTININRSFELYRHEDLKSLTDLKNINSNQICAALIVISFKLDCIGFDITMNHKENLVSLLQTYSLSNIKRSNFIVSDGLGLEMMIRKSWVETHTALYQLFIEKEIKALISKEGKENKV